MWLLLNVFTSACLAVIGTAVVQLETGVIAVARSVSQILDDGVLRCFLYDATGVPSGAAQTGLLAATQGRDWTAD